MKLDASHKLNRAFTPIQMLEPLSEMEVKLFLSMLKKIRLNGNKTNITAATMFIADRLHDEHSAELSTALSFLTNKLVEEPFEGNREILKQVLEQIMYGVRLVEEAKGQ